MSKTPSYFRFSWVYFSLTLWLFCIEVLIALFLKDPVIRPFGGDFLVVILIYYAVRTFWDGPKIQVALGVIFFSFGVEFSQFLNLVEVVGLKGNRLAEVVMGNHFSWGDLLAYTLGVLTVYGIEVKIWPKDKHN